ncbi:hypothetical protein HYS00_05580 [Candidatus Microgenomates bacterium]|nr:hypothetical protein [Candidatus Microgenomates bacterium]
MSEDMSAERPLPPQELQPKPSLIDQIHEVQQELSALTVDWTSPSHESIIKREQYRELCHQENALSAEYFAELVHENKDLLPESFRDATIAYGAGDFAFTIQLKQKGRGGFVTFSRSSHYYDTDKDKWITDSKRQGNGLQVPYMDTQSSSGAQIKYGDFLPMEPFLDPTRSRGAFDGLSKQLGEAAVKPFQPAWLTEHIPGIDKVSPFPLVIHTPSLPKSV